MKRLSRICRRKNRGSEFRSQRSEVGSQKSENSVFCLRSSVLSPQSSVRHGFTLIETMVVATIFSFVAAGIALSFISGIKLWNKAKNTDFAKYQFLLELESIAKDLRQSINEPVIGFEGDAIRLTFPELSGNSIIKVTYSFDQEQAALIKKQVDMKYILAGKEAEEYIEKKFPGWEDFFLSYSYYDAASEGFVWTNEWLKEKGVFTAVKINGKFKGETYTKVIFIHTA